MQQGGIIVDSLWKVKNYNSVKYRQGNSLVVTTFHLVLQEDRWAWGRAEGGGQQPQVSGSVWGKGETYNSIY